MYRYTDIRGKRKSVYAGDLKDLREKEKAVQKDLNDGADYTAGEITAIELIKRYLATKENLKETSKMKYQDALRALDKCDIFHRKIRDIKQYDAKVWAAEMLSNGKKSATIHLYIAIIKNAFQQACDDNVLQRNPFNLKSYEYAKDDQACKEALTPEQQKEFLDFVLADKTGRKHYDDYNILLGTGLRISEYLGLTAGDIDLVNRVIHVDHQLVLVGKGKYKITSLKSKSGKRDLYISDEIYESLVRKIHNSNRLDTGVEIDGYTGFINISNRGNAVMRCHTLNAALKTIVEKHNEQFPDSPLPHITAHILRHTFCTNMVMNGINIKALQHVMGRSDAKITLSVYTHVSNERAIDEMRKTIESANNSLEAI